MAKETSSGKRRFSDQQWQEDLGFLVTSMRSIHPNLFHDVPEDIFVHKVATLTDAIPHLSDNEMIVGLLRLAALTKDWHTQIISRNLVERWFPVRIEQLKDGLFVTAVSTEYARCLGARVLRIGNCSASAAFGQVQEVTAHDNAYSQAYFAPMLMSMPSVLNGLHIIDDVDTLRLELRSLAGKQEEVRITAGEFNSDDDLSWYWRNETAPAKECVTVTTDAEVLPFYWRNIDRYYWFEWLEQFKTVYMGFNMTVNDETECFADFITLLWDLVDRQQAKRMVIDLRHNLGGDHDILPPLIDGIVEREPISRHGSLFVLIGPKNVSASSHCAAWLEQRAHPIFVGEPTGARPNHYADPEHMRLPSSQLRLMVSKRYWQNGSVDDQRQWMEPHILAEFSSDDYFNLRDPAMETVSELIRHG